MYTRKNEKRPNTPMPHSAPPSDFFKNREYFDFLTSKLTSKNSRIKPDVGNPTTGTSRKFTPDANPLEVNHVLLDNIDDTGTSRKVTSPKYKPVFFDDDNNYDENIKYTGTIRKVTPPKVNDRLFNYRVDSKKDRPKTSRGHMIVEDVEGGKKLKKHRKTQKKRVRKYNRHK